MPAYPIARMPQKHTVLNKIAARNARARGVLGICLHCKGDLETSEAVAFLSHCPTCCDCHYRKEDLLFNDGLTFPCSIHELQYPINWVNG